MVAYPLIHGELTAESYTDERAADPRIDALRAKIYCVEDKRFSVEYHDPDKRSIGNALLVELNDGTVLDEVEVDFGEVFLDNLLRGIVDEDVDSPEFVDVGVDNLFGVLEVGEVERNVESYTTFAFDHGYSVVCILLLIG